MKQSLKRVAAAFAASTLCAVACMPAHAADAPKRPKHVLIVVFDQMRPEYAQRFGMQNVLTLEKKKASISRTATSVMCRQKPLSATT
ncbi:hypothetical protein ACFS07_05765 [Undibacterium arcticum]